MPDDLKRWRNALATDDAVQALRAAVQDELAAGDSREQITEQLSRLVMVLRQEQRPDEEEDPILDVLDMLAGWCSPGSAL
ncbi:hypothetical protein [Actinoplanes couchii]|uniref:Uncharacterized protein n=1 Tax=Actinoplanes couchii TaxID=403638 RepID=A0ABQ3XUF2_9ACTN|nr:hypothetical protein [Actinoplanes couchii]MDR6319010.1 hypothetical protein [Actinoplanes couchii]GID62105.1 hypothetical protein Aco03nite_105090 [Actinoplanes couchii]